MSNEQITYVCSDCGEEFLKWQGKCENCGGWNTLKEFKSASRTKTKIQRTTSEVVDIRDIKLSNFSRISSGVIEFDRVLGGFSGNNMGGFVPGSVVLLGGDPGIGKSTLLLQIASKLSNVLYISGEESAEQIKMRFDRLPNSPSDLKLLTETNLDEIVKIIQKEKPRVAVVDSIQTIYSQNFPSTPGSIVQVKECALTLQQLAKQSGTTIILVGHVTKDGSVAGPKTLEHLVDVVLYLEGERYQNTRILRGVKNRFGATDEIGIFEMAETGLEEIKNPSKLFLSERMKNISGSVVASTVEGTRAFLVEVQALTAVTNFGYPQRRASGFDLNRLQLLIAVMQKRAGLNLSNQDVFINVVGGVKIKEPAVDLAIVLSIYSALKNEPINENLCVFGEVGLSGELRKVSFSAKREAEAERLGFKTLKKAKNLIEAISEVKNV